MKTILVPTDFSKVSKNAIDYAVEIAQRMKAKLILFHVYIPVVAADVAVVLPSLDEMGKDCMVELKKIEKSLSLKHKGLQIECACKCGFVVNEINQFAKEKEIDLIVMGMQGAGYLSEKLVGSNTTMLMRNSKRPVLAIDKHVKFRSIKKIALACDYEDIPNKSILNPLKELTRFFKSHVYILNVVPELEVVPSAQQAVSGIKLNRAMEDVNHSFHNTENENVIDGINDFVTEGKMDMVVMIPHKHSVLKTIFNEPNTKRMAFHSHVPLLALHG